MDTQILISIISAVAIIVVAIIAYRKAITIEKLKINAEKMRKELISKNLIIKDRQFKLSTLDKLLDFQAFNQIKDSVDRIFQNTKAEQFLLFIAVNGKTNFRMASVIFEQNKDTRYKINAIIRYRDVEIDDRYRKMLKDVETYGTIDLSTEEMTPQLLKNFYTIEKIKHSKLTFLHRESLDEDNDVVLFSSLATHRKEDWTALENTIIKTEYEGSILHTIKEFI